MTKEEFIPMLSNKAQDIVNYYLDSFKDNHSFTVFFSENSRVVTKNNCNHIIYVNNDNPDDIEYRFLHEFFHCVQFEEGFPTVVGINEEHKELASFLSSIILDLDIRERLEKYEYFQDLKYIKKLVEIDVKVLKRIKKYNYKFELTSIIDMIELAGLIITSDIANIKNKKLVSLTKRVRPEVIDYYYVFSECIKKYSYNDANDVEKIFECLISRFNLYPFVEILTRNNNMGI